MQVCLCVRVYLVYLLTSLEEQCSYTCGWLVSSRACSLFPVLLTLAGKITRAKTDPHNSIGTNMMVCLPHVLGSSVQLLAVLWSMVGDLLLSYGAWLCLRYVREWMVYRISSVSCLADRQEGANHSMWLLTQTRPTLEVWDSKHLILIGATVSWVSSARPLGKQAHEAAGASTRGGVSALSHKIVSSQSWDIHVYWTSSLGPGPMLGMEVCLSILSPSTQYFTYPWSGADTSHQCMCALGLSSYTIAVVPSIAVLPCCLLGLKILHSFFLLCSSERHESPHREKNKTTHPSRVQTRVTRLNTNHIPTHPTSVQYITSCPVSLHSCQSVTSDIKQWCHQKLSSPQNIIIQYKIKFKIIENYNYNMTHL